MVQKKSKTELMSRFLALSAEQRLLVLEALHNLFLAFLVTRFRRFELAVKFGATPMTSPAGKDNDLMARRLAATVNGVANRVRFRALCFQRSLALQRMLRRRLIDARLHYGVGYNQSALSAHVWLTVDQEIVIGERSVEDHVVLMTVPTDVSRL